MLLQEVDHRYNNCGLPAPESFTRAFIFASVLFSNCYTKRVLEDFEYEILEVNTNRIAKTARFTSFPVATAHAISDAQCQSNAIEYHWNVCNLRSALHWSSSLETQWHGDFAVCGCFITNTIDTLKRYCADARIHYSSMEPRIFIHSSRFSTL